MLESFDKFYSSSESSAALGALQSILMVRYGLFQKDFEISEGRVKSYRRSRSWNIFWELYFPVLFFIGTFGVVLVKS